MHGLYSAGGSGGPCLIPCGLLAIYPVFSFQIRALIQCYVRIKGLNTVNKTVLDWHKHMEEKEQDKVELSTIW